MQSHKYHHKFIDTPSDQCVCQTGAETTTHYFLECSMYNEMREELMNSINPLLFLNDLDNIENDGLVKFLLYGHDRLNTHENNFLLKRTLTFIKNSKRFQP